MRAICKSKKGSTRARPFDVQENVYRSPMTCPECGMKYRDFRTGLNYSAVFENLWRTSEDPSRWLYKRRSNVLGLWHEMKQDLWEEHIDWCKGDVVETEDEFDFPVFEESF